MVLSIEPVEVTYGASIVEVVDVGAIAVDGAREALLMLLLRVPQELAHKPFLKVDFAAYSIELAILDSIGLVDRHSLTLKMADGIVKGVEVVDLPVPCQYLNGL